MFRLFCSVWGMVLLLSGCSNESPPSRHNDFTPLTSIEIVAQAPAIAAGTSTRLTVIGNFSGQFSRDITDQAVWSSSKPEIADFVTAGEKSRVTGRTAGVTILTATVGTVWRDFQLTVTPETVTALTITPAAPVVAKGLTGQLTVSGVFSDATTQDLTFDATWASSDPAVATVSDLSASKGLVQARNEGTASISATFGGIGGSAGLTVTAAALQTITVSPANPTLLSQSARGFQATGFYSDGATADITAQVAWSSSRPDIAAVAAGGTAKTLVPGTTVITAGLDGVTGTSSLKVTGGFLTAIALAPVNPRLVKDTGLLVTASGLFSNGSSREITGAVDWSVADPAIASVTFPEKGEALLNASAVTAAPTRLKAQSGAVIAETGLTVTAPSLQSLRISPGSLDLNTGTSGRLAAIATFVGGSTQDVTLNSDWSSAASAVVAVDNSGVVRGRVTGVAAGNGPVIITATYGGISETATVTVRSRTVTRLAISGSPVATVGSQVKFTATATYDDASSRDVSADAAWSSDKPNIAAPVANQNRPGLFDAIDAGMANISASFAGVESQPFPVTVR
jgi:hypothetical protein